MSTQEPGGRQPMARWSLLRAMLEMDIAREGENHSFMIRAGLLAEIIAAHDAALTKASPTQAGDA